jgi:2-methylcitrate dehydratase
VERLLGMDERQTTNALALCGCQSLALTISRAGPGTNWKGLASSATARSCVSATFLARRGVTGPAAVFEGVHGFMQATDTHFDIAWDREGLDAVTCTNIKEYNAEAHSQTALEGLLELRCEHGFSGADIARTEVGIFQTAYDIIGGGQHGERTEVRAKEQADHSLPYLPAVAALDGDVWPAQCTPERMRRDDVQSLLHRVDVQPVDGFTRRYRVEMPSRVTISLHDGRTFSVEKADYVSVRSRPVTFEAAIAKFEHLTAGYVDAPLRREIASAVRALDAIPIADLTGILREAHMAKR